MNRLNFTQQIHKAFQINPVVALLGPRQVGKTTLAKEFAKVYAGPYTWFDLEDVTDLSRLESPKLALQDLTGLIVIDEIQRRPELFPMLRVLVDQHRDQRFLILGSASRDLIHQSTETLAGRISHLELTPFNLSETKNARDLWLRGGFPKAYLADTDDISYIWRQEYITTFLERDIPNLGFRIPAATLRRFWMMLTHHHGQIFNASTLAHSLGTAHTTIRHYLDILTGTFMVRELSPWFENIKKRQIKSPKIYFRDSGILHALNGICHHDELMAYPKLGASWEGFALEEIISRLHAKPEDCYFWGVHNQAELDLLVIKNGQRLGFEVKYTDQPKLTNSMRTAMEILGLNQLTIVIPGNASFLLAPGIDVKGIENL
ncbi:MAG: hypothetical protein K0Q74_322 [Gammaproteobacteria bacterium]|jgi:predicted AAA+ superfamily ATPase|nr:hypothetical protein [Gammaproteobacteria bacterium]